MSISTGRGDEGQTDLLFSRRVAKTHPRVIACGEVDELNTWLGVVRASAPPAALLEVLDGMQQRLVGLMGELATQQADRELYAEKGYRQILGEDVQWLEAIIQEAECEKGIRFRGWARPGEAGVMGAAWLDIARSVCRRAERSTWMIEAEEAEGLKYPRLFLNRLSDALWLLARDGERVE